jgi:hypothetical protein
MAEPFEYAIKKDVRNNPIVREVDEARQRDLWRSVGLGSFLVAVLLFLVWQRVELVRNGYAVGELEQRKAAELEIMRQRRLEIEVLRAPARVEKIATEELHLVEPRPEDAVVIERVRPADLPDASVVAQR